MACGGDAVGDAVTIINRLLDAAIAMLGETPANAETIAGLMAVREFYLPCLPDAFECPPAMLIKKVHAIEVPDVEGIADLVRHSDVAWLQTGGTELPTAANDSSPTKSWLTP